ncbi:MAG: VOC family protein, partial [Chloroflexota bacterium]
MSWNELYVSNADLVLEFYQTVFGWSFAREQDYGGERYYIQNGAGTSIAAMEVIPNEIKGKEEFWVPYFAVENLSDSLRYISGAGGHIVDQSAAGMALTKDPQGAVFMLVENSRSESGNDSSVSTNEKSGFLGRFKPYTFIGLIIIYIAIFLNQQWLWGLIFLLFLIPDLRSGELHFVERISKRENPIWYWLLMITWLWVALYLMITPFISS